MKEFEHSKGPWKCVAQPAGVWRIEPENTSSWLLTIRTSMEPTEEEVANVLLCTAAPELLQALGMLMDTIAFQFAGELEQKVARDAIAKALGVPA